MIQVLTDCTGAKQQVIKNVFLENFKGHEIDLILVKGGDFPTPHTKEDFVLTVQKRVQHIKKSHEQPRMFVATIQKGYYLSGELWHLTACVGIAHPWENAVTAMASSVPISTECSKKKTANLTRNMSDILKEENPEWDKENGSVYTLLTTEQEGPWLEQPLRHCLKMFRYI